MTENLAGRGEGLAGLEAKALAEFTAYFVQNYPGPDTVICKPEWHAPRIFRAAKYALRAALEAAAPPSTGHDEIALVRKVLCAHQTAYARFHNGEGRGVIEAEQMAIGYAAVELAKALATPSPQAPQEQCNAFSTTSAREQSSATASGNLSAAELAIKHCREQINALDKLEGATEYEKGDFAGQIDAYAQVGEILHDLIHVKSVPAATQEPAGSSHVDILAELDHEKYTGPAGKIMQAREPAGSGAKLANGFNMLRIAEEITRGVSSMSKHATATGVSMWVRSVLEREFGSPRKVGEDEAQTFEQWWQAEGVHMVRTTHRTGYELMREAWNAARPSSVPVGEQKQEEGV